MLTGYTRLDASLRAALSRDLPRIGIVAALLVVLALAASLRRARDVVLAALVVTVRDRGRADPHPRAPHPAPRLRGAGAPGPARHHRRRGDVPPPPRPGGDRRDAITETLRHEGPPVAATALTTAAGFAALGVCDFDGLRDLGWVGALGSTVGLVVALVVVPAGLRLTAGRRARAGQGEG